MADPIPFETLLAHRDWVRGLARSLVADPGLADDVEQETWLAAFRSPPRDAETVRPWFLTVARNFARQGRRAASRRARREEAVARREAEPGPDEVVLQADLHRRVVVAVMALDEPYRTAILLRYFEGLSSAAAAARAGIGEEAFRTRVRRGVERLRESLAGDGATDLRALLLPLAVPATPGEADAAGDGAGDVTRVGADRAPGRAAADGARRAARPPAAALLGRSATPVWTLAAAAGLLAAFVLWATFSIDDPAPGGAGLAPAQAPGSAADDGGPALPPAPLPGTPPPAPPEPSSERPADAPPAAAAPPPAGVLELLTRIEPQVPRSGAPLRITATVRNAGQGDVSFFVSDSATELFGEWRFRRDDGALWAPLVPARQSMWTQGMDGAVVRLARGEEWTWDGTFHGFEPLDPEGRGTGAYLTGAPLPPGSYVASCTYAWAREAVPWRAEAFRYEERPQPGLWTGTVHAVERAFVVEPAAEPQLLLDTPARFVPGREEALRVRLVNPLREPLRLRGSFRLVFASKGGSSLVAGFRPGAETAPAPAGAVHDAEIAAESAWTWTIDPSLLLFTATRDGPGSVPAPRGFHEMRPMGSAILGVEYVPEGAKEPTLHSPWVLAPVVAPPDVSPTGLRLVATLRTGADGRRVVALELRNDGAVPLRVLKRLSFPADVGLDFRRTDDGNSAVTWSGESFEAAPPLTARDFAEVRPGESLTRTLDLDRLLAEPLAAGTWEVVATWRALEDGRRLGVTDPAPVVGRLSSDPVRIDGR